MSVTGKKPHESSPHMQLTILLSSSLKSMCQKPHLLSSQSTTPLPSRPLADCRGTYHKGQFLLFLPQSISRILYFFCIWEQLLLFVTIKIKCQSNLCLSAGNDSRTMQAFGPFGMSVECFNWIECIHIALRGSTDQTVIAHEAVLVCTSLSAMVYAYDTCCSKPIGMAFWVTTLTNQICPS